MLRDRWSGLTRPRRVVVVSVAVVAGLVAVGALADSGSKSPGQMAWRDQLADPTTAGDAPSSTGPAGGAPVADPTASSATAGSIAPQAAGTAAAPATTSPSASSGATAPGAASPTTAPTSGGGAGGDPLAGLRVAAEAPRTGYQRTLFGDWIDADHDHCDTRQEILEAQSETPALTERSGSVCKVLAGQWLSAWDDRSFTDPAKIQIDHVVPLAEAWDSGAAGWDSARRVAFANDLADPELMAVSASSNESKGDDDPGGWKPPSQGAWCLYATDWVRVKVTWSLTADPAEVSALRSMFATCPGGRPATPPTPATTAPSAPTTQPSAAPTTTTAPPTVSGSLTLTGLDCPGEGVTVHNGGLATVDLTGWSIHDDGTKHTFAFPAGYHLAPGASVVVRSGGPAGAGELGWINSAVWNNDGDLATLLDVTGTIRSTRSC